MENKTLLRPEEVQQIARCSKSMAYRIIKNLNEELSEKGYLVFRGRVNRDYLLERLGIKEDK